MANFAFAHFVLLAIASGGFAQTFKGFSAYNFLRTAPREEPQVVEVVRWRQSVCITSEPGVQPCAPQHGYRSGQSSPKKASGQNEHGANKKTGDLSKKLNQDESKLDFSSFESLEDDDVPKRSARTPRAQEQPKLYSSRVRRFVPLENMGTSSFDEPVAKVTRQRRYLRLGPMMGRSPPKRQTVYVTKVVDSPVTATLVASTCLPDIGIPICDHIQNSGPAYAPLGRGQQQAVSYVPPTDQASYGPATNQGGYAPPPAAYQRQQPVSQIPSNNQGIADYPNYQMQYQQSTTTQRPDWIQIIEENINRPNYVQTNEQPAVKPVVVVQPTPEPTLLEGINSWFMQDGNWFNVWSRPSNNQQHGGNQIVTSVVQLPAYIPFLQQYMYRPENDISDPNVLNQHSPPGAGPPTEPPGIFGGLFASPSRPEGADAQATTTTTTQAPWILDHIFRPTNRPLVIERPDKIPIVVEKPVYVVEQPVIPGLMDIFHNPNRPTEVNSTNGAEVITDPVYVLQRPPNRPPLFGLIPNEWNIFGGPSTESNPARPKVELTENLQPSQLVVVDDHPPTYHEPAVQQDHQPPASYHGQPSAAPAVKNVISVHAAAAPAPAQPAHPVQDPQSYTNVTATGLIDSSNSTIGRQGASLSVGVDLGQSVETSPVKTGIDLENSETDRDPGTYQEANGLPEPGSETETEEAEAEAGIVNGVVETTLVQTGVSNDSGISDAHDRSLLTVGMKELEKIVVPEVAEQIDNEA